MTEMQKNFEDVVGRYLSKGVLSYLKKWVLKAEAKSNRLMLERFIKRADENPCRQGLSYEEIQAEIDKLKVIEGAK